MRKDSFAKVFLLLAFAASSATPTLLADFVSSSDGDLKDVSVSSIDEKSVSLSDGRRIDLTKVSHIEFPAFDIPAKPTGVILKDGSILNGLVRGRTGNSLLFRSTSLGILEMQPSCVAGYIYDRPSFASLDAAKLPQAPCAIQKDGSAVQGKILWSDEKSAGVMSSEGLVKLEASTLACVLEAPFEKGAQAILRNGDVLNGQLHFQGDSLTFKSDAVAARNVKLKALRRLNLKQ